VVHQFVLQVAEEALNEDQRTKGAKGPKGPGSNNPPLSQ
jgi:hypothetical protein